MGEVVVDEAEDVLVLLLELDYYWVVGYRGVDEVGGRLGHVRGGALLREVCHGRGDDGGDCLFAEAAVEGILPTGGRSR